MDKHFVVFVDCKTYNHAHYIEDAMNGFVMQKTNFPFVCMIMDDASTDGEQDVIRRYIEKEFDVSKSTKFEDEKAVVIFVPHKTNENCTFAVYFLKENHYSQRKDKLHYYQDILNDCKYVAFCEGDDYWTNPLKLQMQVDLLETNSDYGLCYSNCDIYYSDVKSWERSIFKNKQLPINGENPLIDTAHWYLANMTWVYRKKVLDAIPKNDQYIDGAIYLLLNMCMRTKIVYLPEVTGVYRRHKGSESNFSDKQLQLKYNYQKNSFKLLTSYAKYFRNSDLYLNAMYTDALFDLLIKAVRYNDTEVIDYINSYFDNKLNVQGIFDKITKYEKEISNIKQSRIYLISCKVSKIIHKVLKR